MKKPSDQVTYGPMIGPGSRVARRQLADGTVQTVVIKPPQDGVPLAEGEEIVHIDEGAGEERDGVIWFPSTTTYRHGPPQVATPAYCEGYDRIFGKKQHVGQA